MALSLPPLPYDRNSLTISRGWLLLACASLIVPGLTAIVLVILRSTPLAEATTWTTLFRAALVVHVDLSAFVWFMAFAGLFWSIVSTGQRLWLKRISLGLSFLGTGLIAISPAFNPAGAIMNNYIPVIDHPVFFGGLASIGLGLTLSALDALFSNRASTANSSSAIILGIKLSALIALLAMMAVIMSTVVTSPTLEAYPYFEQVFWNGGHIAQFCYTLLLMLALLWIGDELGLLDRLANGWIKVAFLLAALPAIASPFLASISVHQASEYRLFFTQLMEWGHLGVMLLIVPILYWLIRRWPQRQLNLPATNALTVGLFLFLAGGVIGYAITGVNTIIPAHYHGMIVGIVLVLMGLTYVLLPKLGYRNVYQSRTAVLQPLIYGLGQLMHVAGLLISGMHGALRKTVGVEQQVSMSEQLGTQLIRFGGLLAVLGGLLFLLVVWRSIRGHTR